ncbi:MAG: FliH/SctL family protein [Candidatus Calescibacterium sp.]|nr:FliH/SctL family protein [Candidatus Calescibacterium sp.]MCX7972124.1 FliH/SctL family protein [bacterium]MDW8194812.1 FliH/SctL family protein [Candidatus Calescibacterium sp.]
MGIIKKSNEQNIEKEYLTSNPSTSKIIGNIIKQEFLSKDILSINIENDKISKKIIKRDEVSLPINQIIEEIKDVNIVAKSSIEFELEEEKNRYQKLNQELEQKINEQNLKLQEIENMKNTILSEAQKQAKTIIEKAIQDAQTKIQEALEQGYKQGFEQGLNEAQKKLEEQYNKKLNEIQEEINNFTNIRKKLVKEFEREIIDLVFEVAEKIISKKIQEEHSIVTSYLADLLSRVERSKTITIWVNPEELEEVRNYKENLKYLLEDVENLSIAPDERISKGGCIIETNFGKIDSRISTKLEVLKEILLKNK